MNYIYNYKNTYNNAYNSIYNKWFNSYNKVYKKIYNICYVDDLDTGDIVLFHGTNSIVSYVVEFATCSKYSHCGIVLKNPKTIGIDVPDGIYMIESGYDNPPDVSIGKRKFGVEVVDLKQSIEEYVGTVYCIKLKFTRNPLLYSNLTTAYSLVKKDYYDVNPLDLIKTILNINIGNNNRTDMFICSALVCYILYACNIIYYVNWDLVEPKDLANLNNIDNIMRYNLYNSPRVYNTIKRQQILFKNDIKINSLTKLYV